MSNQVKFSIEGLKANVANKEILKGINLEINGGEIHAIMDEGERLMRAGDVLVQRGTNHAWSNRTEKPARVAFVLIDAKPV